MKNLFFNELLDDYNDQIDDILDDEEKMQKNTYIFYSVYEVGGMSDLGECCDNMCYIMQCCFVLYVVFFFYSCCCGANDYSGEFEACNFENSCWGMGCSICQEEVSNDMNAVEEGLFGGSALCCNLSFCCEGGCCDGYLCDC